MPASQLPGQRWFAWLRNPVLLLGVLIGLYLSLVLGVWLVIANRVPWSANFAPLRNLLAAALALLVALIPVARFLRSPARLFASGVLSWAILSLTYLLMGFVFQRLHSRMGPLHVFMLGAVAYGVVAVIVWVASLLLAARHEAVGIPRRRHS